MTLRSLIMAAPTVASREIADPAAFALELSTLDCNDQGNARRFIARCQDTFRYVSETGWAMYDGKRWDVDGGEDAARRAMHGVIEQILEEVEVCYAEANRSPDLDERSSLKARAEGLFKWKISSGNKTRYEGALEVARPYLTVKPRDFDADAYALNLENGTMRVRFAGPGRIAWDSDDVLELTPHDRDDLCSRIVPVAYDPKATCPQFDAFLARVQPDAAVRGFLQRFLGYGLTGLTVEQVLLLNIGEGANGKSTLFDLIGQIVGGYGGSINFSSLVRDDNKRGGDPSPDLARLPGVRVLRTSEPDEGVRLAEAMIKQVTGGEEISVRHLNKGFFEFYPVFKLIISGNHRPNIRGQDGGIWRRVLLILWDVIIPPEERDRDLGRKLLDERAGVLNWLLDGLRLYLEIGLAVPDEVRAATDSYREDSDPLGQFIAQCVVREAGGEVGARAFYDAYARWCRANAVTPLKETTVGRRLPERGYVRRKTRDGNVYVDIVLQNVPLPRSSNEGDD